MSKKSKNVILTEKPKNFKKIRKHQKSQKTFFEHFWYHFWPFLVIWRQTKFTNFTRTPLYQKCQTQDIVQAWPPILFLVYFYDSYLQHIKSCQGKVDFEMNLRISLRIAFCYRYFSDWTNRLNLLRNGLLLWKFTVYDIFIFP